MHTVRRVRAWFTRHPMAGDALWIPPLLAFIGSGCSILVTGTVVGQGGGLPVAGAWLLGVTLTVALLWRRLLPELFAGAVVVAHVLQLVHLDEPTPLNLLVPVALYAIAAHSRRRWYRAWLVLALLAAVVAGLDWYLRDGPYAQASGPTHVVSFFFTSGFIGAVVVATWVMGELARERRVNLAALHDRALALQERADALERERDQRGRLAAQEERARIAREMHDVVAHSLSVIVVQSDGGAYAATHGSDPEKRARVAAAALETIGATAREALAETRRLVGVLRSEQDETEYAPRATLETIGELVQRMHDAGVAATYRLVGDPDAHAPLSAGAETAAYRVVQESLTNAVKHGDEGVHIVVTLEHTQEGLRIAVRDDGPGSGGGTKSDGQGHGLLGMRERVTTYGGTLTARDRFDGGFEVLAELPAGEGAMREDGSGGAVFAP